MQVKRFIRVIHTIQLYVDIVLLKITHAHMTEIRLHRANVPQRLAQEPHKVTALRDSLRFAVSSTL